MKRILKIVARVVIMVVLIIATIVTALIAVKVNYGEDASETSKIVKVSDNESETVSFMKLPEFSSADEMVEIYRGEVLKRQVTPGNFTTEEEIAFWEHLGYVIQNPELGFISFYNQEANEIEYLYFPVFYIDRQNVVYSFYTSENGYIEYLKFYDEHGEKYEICINAHTDEDNLICTSGRWALTYDEKLGKVYVWCFGQVDSTYEVPAGSVYTGLSEMEGYIFRSNTDIYSLNEVGMYWIQTAEPGVELIAREVEQVIATNYYYSCEGAEVPVFKMTDGSIKAYVTSEGGLVNLIHEGGYDKFLN